MRAAVVAVFAAVCVAACFVVFYRPPVSVFDFAARCVFVGLGLFVEGVIVWAMTRKESTWA